MEKIINGKDQFIKDLKFANPGDVFKFGSFIVELFPFGNPENHRKKVISNVRKLPKELWEKDILKDLEALEWL